MSRRSLAERFRRAKEFVIQGWVQGTIMEYEFIDGRQVMRVCALGAMLAADEKLPDTSGAHVDQELAGLFGRVNGIRNLEIAAWNDWGLRTQNDVVRAFEKAATEAERLEKPELEPVA